MTNIVTVVCKYEPRGDDCLEGFCRGGEYFAEKFVATKGRYINEALYNLRDLETNNWMGTCTKRQLDKYFKEKGTK